MIKYICKNEKCGKETEFARCPYCQGNPRTEIKSSDIYWCPKCNVPTYDEVCLLCGSIGERVGTDARPVFPEERLLIEIIMGVPMKYKEASFWNISGNYYYADGKRIPWKKSMIKNSNIEDIKKALNDYREENKINAFQTYLDKFIATNKHRYEYIVSEACDYIREVSEGYTSSEMFVSFSGGKDSSVTSSLAMKALGRPDILHIYGDTTLEFPETKKYIERFMAQHPQTPLMTSKNKDKNFDDLVEQLGPPSRVMRWCCTIFKTGAIQRRITSLFRNNSKILTFYGIRHSESASRSNYDRESDSPKITKQKTVSPIIEWLDFDVWLYILTERLDFNDAYRTGYTRVGCWCCPNNSSWSGFLSQIYMPMQYNHFREMLINFAESVGKPDPEEYVDTGAWKARQGGNGISHSNTSILTFEPCVLEENAINFELQKTITEDLYELFKPFGYIDKEMGNKRLGEVYVKDKNGVLQLKLTGKIGSNNLKVSIINPKAGHCTQIKQVENKIKCQITKYQMCMGCLACESICSFSAINIKVDNSGMKSYKINDDKCRRCGHCINHYIGGCYIRKVLTIHRD